MYLRGSKWSYNQRKRRINPLRIIFLAALIGGAVYVNQVVVPATPPLFVPTTTPTRSPELFVNEAASLLDQGKLVPAASAYREAIKADPKNASNYITLTRLLIYTGQYKDAVIQVQNALLLNPNNATAHALLGWANAFLGNYLDAESSLATALKIEPNNAVAYAYLAETEVLKYQSGVGDTSSLDKAIEASHNAQTYGPNLMETHRARGIVLEQTGNSEEAVTEFEAAIQQDDNIAALHIALGRNYRFLQQYDKALEEFNRATGLNPSDPEPLLYISRTYAAEGEYAKAIQYGEQAIKVSPSDPFLYGNLGTFYYRNHDYPTAIERLSIALHGGKAEDGSEVQGLPLDYGRVAEYYYIYGLSLAHQGQCGEALQIAQALNLGVPNDEISVANAQAMVDICTELAKNPTTGTLAAGDTTPGAETATPAPVAATPAAVEATAAP